MPKVKYCSVAPKRDPVKGLILEYKALQKLDTGTLALKWGISRATCSKRLNEQHSDQWLGEAKDLCKKLNIPIDEFRAALRY